MLPMPIRDLREYVLERSSERCEFPHCPQPFQEMAHLRHRGIGGGPSRNTQDNVLGLCRVHHWRYDNGAFTDGDWWMLLATTATPLGDGWCDWPRCIDPHDGHRYSPPDGVHLEYLMLCTIHNDVLAAPTLAGRRAETRLVLMRLVELLRSVEGTT